MERPKSKMRKRKFEKKIGRCKIDRSFYYKYNDVNNIVLNFV